MRAERGDNATWVAGGPLDRGARFPNKRPGWLHYLIVVGVTLATFALRWSFGFTKPPLLSIFILPVCMGAYLCGLVGGCVATLIAAISVDYFLLEPIYSLSIWDPGERADTIVFLFTGAAFSALIDRLKQTTAVATKSEQSERALREQWEQILLITPGAICSFRRDSQGRVSFPFSTSSIKDFYALDPCELAIDGAPALALLNPADAVRIQESITRSADALAPFHEEWRVNHPSKGEIWVECHSSPLAQADGSTVWHGLLLDITRRKRAELLSERNRAAYESLVNKLPQLVWTCTPEGECDFLNEQWIQFTGLSAQEQLGQGWLAQVHPDDRSSVMDAWTASVGQGTAFNLAYRVRRHDGVYHWFDGRANPISDEAGKIVKWFGSSTDIQLTYDLNERLSQQALLLDLSLEPILVWSPSGGIEFWNKGCEQCYGFSAVEAIGRSSHALLQTHLPEAQSEFVDKLLHQGAWSGELLHTTKQGESLTVLCRMQVVDYQGRKVVLESNRDISVRKQTEEALRLWAETFERAEFALVVTDAITNTFKAVNATYAKERGFMPEELLGRSVFSIYPADRLEETKQFVVEVDKAGHGSFESEHLTKDGRRFPVWMDITTLKNSAGQAQLRIACAFDITERKAAEAALRTSEARLKVFIEHAPAALAMFDTSLCYLAASRRWLSEYGLEEQEIVSRSLYEVFPETPEAWRSIHRRALAGETLRRTEQRFVRADGREQWLQGEVRPWYIGEDVVGGIVIFSEDITEQKQAQAALADSELQHRTLLNALADGVFVAQDYKFVFANDALPTLLGYDYQDFIGSPFERIIAADFLAVCRERFAQRSGDGPEPLESYEVRVRHKSGAEFWVALRASRTTFNGKPAVLGILHDVSERKRIENEIRALNLDLERRVTERTAELQAANQELESFAYSVSHDLRAPVRAMQGFSQALIEDFGPDLNNEARAYLEQIEKGSRRMADLVDGLLVLSRATRGDLDRCYVDLGALAQLIVDELRAIEPQRQVSLELGTALQAWGDARMLELVLRNLLGNAWKYTGAIAQARIRLDASRTQEGITFCVADNGAGFNMAHAEKLFQPFQRLHRQDEFPGLGIGLATVQRIIHRHGGQIWARGQPGQGAQFYFQLPVNENGLGAEGK